MSNLFRDAGSFGWFVVVFGMLEERWNLEREGEPRDIVSYSAREHRTPYPDVYDGVWEKEGCLVSSTSSVVGCSTREWTKEVDDVAYPYHVGGETLE